MRNFNIRISILFIFLCVFEISLAQTPDKLYGELFEKVQMEQIFADGKTFVDMVPLKTPQAIMLEYQQKKNSTDFNLKEFVNQNFELPKATQSHYSVKNHIEELWKVLERKPDTLIAGSTLIPLPYNYIVPGGRFREVYYWDSYFTMHGLQESGEVNTIENMVKNFAFLIDKFGHIPNGNRTYYISRSQPPFFALMVELLANLKGNQVYQTFLPQLLKEHDYWTSGNRLVNLSDGNSLSRYFDESSLPRQESYREDVLVAQKSGRNLEEMYHHLRAGAASGWDYSSRWFNDQKNIETIKTTHIIPVDLNALLYRQEMIISHTYDLNHEFGKGKEFKNKAAARLKLIEKYCWNKSISFYTDYDFVQQKQQMQITAAGLVPLFAIENQELIRNHIPEIKKNTVDSLLKDGGIVTTTKNTGQQWDAPNGWAPLEWMAIKGFKNYNEDNLAETIAKRWIGLNLKVFNDTGKLMEKYNVENLSLKAGGGEYDAQDGFGWTNGVLLKLLNMYPQFDK